MNTCDGTVSITALANVIACQLSDEEIALLAAILVQLGDTLTTITAQRALCNTINQSADK